MNRLLSRFSLRFVIIIFCLPFLILLTITFMVFYQTGTSRFSKMMDKNTRTLVAQTRDSINDSLENVYYLSNSLTSSHTFYKIHDNIGNNKAPVTPEKYLEFSKSLRSFLEHNPTLIDSIGVYFTDNSVNLYLSNKINCVMQPSFQFSDYYNRCAPFQLNWLTSRNDYPYAVNAQDEAPGYSLIELLGSTDTDLKGFFLIGINDRLFTDQIKNCRLTENSSVTILQDGKLVYQDTAVFGNHTLDNLTETELIQIKEKVAAQPEADSLSFALSGHYAVYMPLSLEGAGVLAIIPMDEMFLDYRDFSNTLAILAVIVLAGCAILYLLISQMLSFPVVNLLEQIDHIQASTLAIPIQGSGSKEMLRISQGINNLLSRIQVLMDSLQTEMQAKQITQLQALHSQINPHFMYNALDAMKQLCELGETEKAGQMIDSLAMYYRIGVSKGRDIIRLNEELTHTDMYLGILKTRFEDFHYEFTIPRELMDCTIIKITLQPIVENALYHGLRPYRTDGHIRITVSREQNDIYIRIEDDGGGMAENVLEEIRTSLNAPAYTFKDQSVKIYGVKNVHDRIRLTYGKGYGLSIQSELDKGTAVTIKIPYRKEECINDENTICG